jgi:hypothetical protein
MGGGLGVWAKKVIPSTFIIFEGEGDGEKIPLEFILMGHCRRRRGRLD